MLAEIRVLTQVVCWEEVVQPKYTSVLHIKFGLWREPSHNGDIKKYKARFVVCGNEEHNNGNDCFSPIVDCTLIKLLQSLAMQKKWKVKPFEFQHAFSNCKLDHTVSAEPTKHLVTAKRRELVVMRPNKVYMDSKYASRIWLNFH